jgi:hypothetical protein
MGAQRLLQISACAAALALAACGGGGGGGISVPPVQTSGPVTFNYTPGFVAGEKPSSISVDQSGLATQTVNGATVSTMQIGAALTAQIFSDVQKAWPLNQLPASQPVPDAGGLSVTWGGQTSPDIRDAPNGIEAALNTDANALARAFPPPQ